MRETRIAAGPRGLALRLEEADEIGRFNGAASVVFLEFLASSGIFGSWRGAQWLLASTGCEFLVSCAVFLFSARSPMVAGLRASTGCEFLFLCAGFLNLCEEPNGCWLAPGASFCLDKQNAF